MRLGDESFLPNLSAYATKDVLRTLNAHRSYLNPQVVLIWRTVKYTNLGAVGNR
jgi:hypothetical protein